MGGNKLSLRKKVYFSLPLEVMENWSDEERRRAETGHTWGGHEFKKQLKKNSLCRFRIILIDFSFEGYNGTPFAWGASPLLIDEKSANFKHILLPGRSG